MNLSFLIQSFLVEVQVAAIYLPMRYNWVLASLAAAPFWLAVGFCLSRFDWRLCFLLAVEHTFFPFHNPWWWFIFHRLLDKIYWKLFAAWVLRVCVQRVNEKKWSVFQFCRRLILLHTVSILLSYCSTQCQILSHLTVQG